MEKIIGFDKQRKIPRFANKTLVQQYKKYRKVKCPHPQTNELIPKLVLFADVYTNYNNPQIGMATVKVFDKLGIHITLSKLFDDGRASQSQGLVDLTTKRAVKLAAYLEDLIDEGKDIIVTEPSVLALFRYDYKKILSNYAQFEKLEKHTYDPIEYLNMLVLSHKLVIEDYMAKSNSSKPKIFYHGHCQMKSINAGYVASDFFQRLNYFVDVSKVECCGMAGSFGYKKEYYSISKNVGNDLIQQIKRTDSFDSKTIILASGTSCREQIGDELNNPIYHPIEFLHKIL